MLSSTDARSSGHHGRATPPTHRVSRVIHSTSPADRAPRHRWIAVLGRCGVRRERAGPEVRRRHQRRLRRGSALGVHAAASLRGARDGRSRPARAREQERAVERARLRDRHEIDWPVRVSSAPRPRRSCRRPTIRAVLVLLGLRRHGRLDRVVHDDTALNVMRTRVVPGARRGRGDERAAGADPRRRRLRRWERARRARRACDGRRRREADARLRPADERLPARRGGGPHSRHGGGGRLREAAQEFDGKGAQLDQVVLHTGGSESPGQALLEYANEIGSDLITAGSVQHSRLDRWMVGSVSAELVRDGRRSVLIVPPRRRELDAAFTSAGGRAMRARRRRAARPPPRRSSA